MQIVRNVDVATRSEVSFDGAWLAAVAKAAKRLRGILAFRGNETECIVEPGNIIAYRVTDDVVIPAG